jgi:hypothetical protein
MAGEHGCAVIATVGIAIEEYVATALGPHVVQSYGSELSSSRISHAMTLHYRRSGDNPPPDFVGLSHYWFISHHCELTTL